MARIRYKGLWESELAAKKQAERELEDYKKYVGLLHDALRPIGEDTITYLDTNYPFRKPDKFDVSLIELLGLGVVIGEAARLVDGKYRYRPFISTYDSILWKGVPVEATLRTPKMRRS